MFARFDIKVTSLHREAVGPISLSTLGEGKYRAISDDVVHSVLESPLCSKGSASLLDLGEIGDNDSQHLH